jgi:hypothetical protein
VVSAHLFGVPRSIPAPRTRPTRRIHRQSGADRDDCHPEPEARVAIISDGGALQGVFGWRQYRRRLLAFSLPGPCHSRSRGALETLQLPRLLGTACAVPPVVRRPGADPRTHAAVDNIRRMVQQDPGLSIRSCAPCPPTTARRETARVSRLSGRNRQIFSKLGLKPGDLVTAINGTAAG